MLAYSSVASCELLHRIHKQTVVSATESNVRYLHTQSCKRRRSPGSEAAEGGGGTPLACPCCAPPFPGFPCSPPPPFLTTPEPVLDGCFADAGALEECEEGGAPGAFPPRKQQQPRASCREERGGWMPQ